MQNVYFLLIKLVLQISIIFLDGYYTAIVLGIFSLISLFKKHFS